MKSLQHRGYVLRAVDSAYQRGGMCSTEAIPTCARDMLIFAMRSFRLLTNHPSVRMAPSDGSSSDQCRLIQKDG